MKALLTTTTNLCPNCGGQKFTLNRDSLNVCINCGTLIDELTFSNNTDIRSREGFISQSEFMGPASRTVVGHHYERLSTVLGRKLNKTQSQSLNYDESCMGKIHSEITSMCTSLGISKNISHKLSTIAQRIFNKLPAGTCSKSPINLAAAVIYHGKKLYNYQIPLKLIVKESGQTKQKILLAIKQSSEIFSQTFLTKKVLILKDAKVLIKNFWNDQENSGNPSIFMRKRDIEVYNLALRFLRSESATLMNLQNLEMVSATCLGLAMVSLKFNKIKDILYSISNRYNLSCVKLFETMLKVFRQRNEDATEKSMIRMLPGYYRFMINYPLSVKNPKVIKVEKFIHSIMTTLESTYLNQISDSTYQSVLNHALKCLKKYYTKFGDKHVNTIAVSVIAASIIKHDLRNICSVHAIAKIGMVGGESIKNCFLDMENANLSKSNYLMNQKEFSFLCQ